MSDEQDCQESSKEELKLYLLLSLSMSFDVIVHRSIKPYPDKSEMWTLIR